MRPYIIGTGFFQRDKNADTEGFYRMWWRNKMRFAKPSRIFVIASSGCTISPKTMRECPAEWIHLDANLGHIHHVNGDPEWPYEWSSYTITLLTLCLLAYQDGSDLFFCEQDMLAFGGWVAAMYSDIGDANLSYGVGKIMPCFQSLMLIKHQYLPYFVRDYLAGASEKNKEWEGERRMQMLADKSPKDFKPFSFGYDRDRPFNVEDPVFYLQHITSEELTTLKDAGLLD